MEPKANVSDFGCVYGSFLFLFTANPSWIRTLVGAFHSFFLYFTKDWKLFSPGKLILLEWHILIAWRSLNVGWGYPPGFMVLRGCWHLYEYGLIVSLATWAIGSRPDSRRPVLWNIVFLTEFTKNYQSIKFNQFKNRNESFIFNKQKFPRFKITCLYYWKSSNFWLKV